MAQLTFYDEFGVAPSATPEQIRKAHHTLSRLLHPDLQTDPQLRQMAEIQMRRLNSIAATLLDPLRRRAYDTGLAVPVVQTVVAPLPPASTGRGIGLFAGIVVTGIVLTGAILYLMAGDLIPLQNPPPDLPKTAITSIEESDDPPAPVVVKKQPGRVPVLRRMTSPYEGLWTFIASNNPGFSAASDPEFIELRISNDRGFLHGFYRTRARLSPRDLSSNFTFSGAATGDSTSLALRAADGSEGTIELRLDGPDALQVDWNLNAFIGSAVLARIN